MNWKERVGRDSDRSGDMQLRVRHMGALSLAGRWREPRPAGMRLAFRKLHVFVVAGEPSGDALGAAVMTALRARVLQEASQRDASPDRAEGSGTQGGDVRFSGVGGPLMRRAGLEVVFDMADLAVMGLWELLPHIPRLLMRLRQARRAILAAQPDIVLTIDSKGFTFRLLRSVSPRNARAPWTTVHYVAPSVWAYKGDHAKTLQFLSSRLDLLLILFPFEDKYFRQHVPTVCTGHPVFELARVRESVGDELPPPRECCSDSMRSAGATKLLLLPGSRVQEIQANLPLMLRALALLPREVLGAQVTILCANSRAAEDAIRRALGHFEGDHNRPPVRVSVVVPNNPDERYNEMKSSDLAIAVSGTVTLELAAAGTPGLVIYRGSFITEFVAKKIAAVEYVSLPNLLTGKKVMPELLFTACSPKAIAHETLRLLRDSTARQGVFCFMPCQAFFFLMSLLCSRNTACYPLVEDLL
jgi:lipid-A-disaccharide synthase